MCVETAAVVVTNGISLGSTGVIPIEMNHLSYQRACLNARLIATTPISIERRITLGQRLAAALSAPTHDDHAMSVAALYAIAPGEIGAAYARTSAYIRWGMSFPVSDTAEGADELPIARVRRYLRRTLCDAHALLQEHFIVEPVKDDPVDALLRQNPCAPVVELAYAGWPPTTDWLAPAHVQPVVDLLAAQPDWAALQITLERVADPDASGASRLRLGVVALGAAAHQDALRLLARELRGNGSLVAPSWRTPVAAPKLWAIHARTADERARIHQNISGPSAEPWAPTTHTGDITLTSDEAGLLLPLPFALFAESEQ